MSNTLKLMNYIAQAYNSTAKQLAPNIVRGHLRSISADIEDGIAFFISDAIPPNYQLFLDPSIHVNKKNHRPDLLVVDPNNNVVAMIEIKANMGWCRDATKIIDSIVTNHNEFSSAIKLECEFSNKQKHNVTYDRGTVQRYLLSLTDWNCPAQYHVKNKQYAANNNVKYFCLFTDWYSSLKMKEADGFINDLISFCP